MKKPRRMTSRQIRLAKGAILLILVCLAFSYYLAKTDAPKGEHLVPHHISSKR